MNIPKFQQVQLNIILEKNSHILSAERTDKLKKIIEKKGKYPEMEKRLAQ